MPFFSDKFVDFTPILNLQERKPRVITSLNLFETDFHATEYVEVGREVSDTLIIPARERNGERNWLVTDRPNGKVFKIPFFPVDRNIKGVDIQSFRTLMDPNQQLDSLPAHVTRYTGKIQDAIDKTKEVIFTSAILGTAFTGATGSMNTAYNWYTEWNVTQLTVSVDFASTTINPAAVIEGEARGHIMDLKGDNTVSTNVIALCGRGFFSKLVNSNFIITAYQMYRDGVQPLRDRIGGNADYRQFDHMGVTYIEVDSPLIGTDEAFLLPTGISGMFQAHYAPADVVDANQLAVDQYLFMFEELRTVSLQSEFSLLAVNTRPELVVRLVAA